MRLLIAEENVSFAHELVGLLEKNHYTAEAVYYGEDALLQLSSGSYDAAILDISASGADSIAVVKKLREQGNEMPVMILSEKAEIEDKVLGLDSGANDYVTKPFDTRELLARIRAMTRSLNLKERKLIFGNVTLNQEAFTLSSPAGSIRLPNKEFQVMEILMSNPRQLVSTARLMEKIWGYDTDVEINVVWAYISYLRKKLVNLQANIQIASFRNAGYSLEEKM